MKARVDAAKWHVRIGDTIGGQGLEFKDGFSSYHRFNVGLEIFLFVLILGQLP